MRRLLQIVLALCLLSLFVFGAKAQGVEPNEINCQQVAGEYLCEVIHIQAYEDGEALRIASHVKAKVDTEIVIGTDSIFVEYTEDKTYQITGYGSNKVEAGTRSKRTQVLTETKSVKDARLELVVLINGIRDEK